MLPVRFVGVLVWLVAGHGLIACKGTTITEDDVDHEVSARESCAWQAQCLEEFDREFGTVERCVELELYRHAEPEACQRANAAFKTCVAGLTCEEFEQVRVHLDALQSQADASVPEDVRLPCLLDLFFYNEACAEWTCASGQVINRQDVCDGQDECADRSDETGCP